MAYSRAAVSVGNLVSVARMKGRYASMGLGRSANFDMTGGTACPPAASTRRTVSRCTRSCLAMVPTRHFLRSMQPQDSRNQFRGYGHDVTLDAQGAGHAVGSPGAPSRAAAWHSAGTARAWW